MTTEALARNLLHEYKQDIGECLSGLRDAKHQGLAARSEALRKRLGAAVRLVARIKREHPTIHGPRGIQMRLPI